MAHSRSAPKWLRWTSACSQFPELPAGPGLAPEVLRGCSRRWRSPAGSGLARLQGITLKPRYAGGGGGTKARIQFQFPKLGPLLICLGKRSCKASERSWPMLATSQHMPPPPPPTPATLSLLPSGPDALRRGRTYLQQGRGCGSAGRGPPRPRARPLRDRGGRGSRLPGLRLLAPRRWTPRPVSRVTSSNSPRPAPADQ